MSTTTKAVLAAIKTRLIGEPNIAGDRLGDNTVLFAVEDRPPPGPDDLYVLIVPGAASLPHYRSGVSLARLNVRIVVYKRQNSDRVGSDEARLTSTEGLLTFLETLETKMSHSWLAGILIGPMVCVSMDAPSAVQGQDGAGWLRGSREFSMTYDPGLPLIQSNNAGTASADQG